MWCFLSSYQVLANRSRPFLVRRTTCSASGKWQSSLPHDKENVLARADALEGTAPWRKEATEIKSELNSKSRRGGNAQRNQDWVHDWKSLANLKFLQDYFIIVVVVLGTILLPQIRTVFLLLVGSEAGEARKSVVSLITGTLSPLIGIFFGTLCSMTVNVLRQKQQDLRSLLNQELACIRTLCTTVKDIDMITGLIMYTKLVDIEVFHFHAHDDEFTNEQDRETLYVRGENLLYELLSHVNALRLLDRIEDIVVKVILFRTQRIASLHVGFPSAHYNLLLLLSVFFLVSFALQVATDPSSTSSPAMMLLWAMLLGLVSLAYSLINDLKNPVAGKYRLSHEAMDRTLKFLNTELESLREESVARHQRLS